MFPLYIADLHIHSSYSRATSKDCDIPHLDFWARRKGIGLVGTGDFTHPAWRAHLRELLTPIGNGVYKLKSEFRILDGRSFQDPRFVVTGEISCIYKRNGKTRKVHNLIILPSIDDADELSAKLEAIGNIHSDGRPILGLDSRDLLDIVLSVCPNAELIPAHIWTPHFSMFGAFSDFNTIDECFGDLSEHIHAVETGLSSDPPMNWRLSQLDGINLISNSDAHSPSKLGREANILDGDISYSQLINAIRTGDGLLGTIEFFPEEGKYHLDGHRNCGVCLTPTETISLGGVCPVCGKKVTIGVEHRVEELADRPIGFRPDAAKPFQSLAPLPEVIAASNGWSAQGKKTLQLYEKMLCELGNEFYILRECPADDIGFIAGPCIAEGIRRLRSGRVERKAGFDGEYGVITLLSPSERQRLEGQFSLFSSTIGETSRSKFPAYNNRKTAVDRPLNHVSDTVSDQLNPQQFEAVTAPFGVVSVIAGPGTGKTKTLISRIAYLINEKGVDPHEITAVTFTKLAAFQLQQRIQDLLGGRKKSAGITVGTIHSICAKLLGDVKIVPQEQALDLAFQVATEYNLSISPARLLQDISKAKNGIPFEDIPIDADIFSEYENRLSELHVLDFDDILINALDIDVKGRRSFSHVLVDEFQDINSVQYDLITKWSSTGQSLFVIGDPDQSIYGFRGASSGWFQKLKSDRTDTCEINLTENYRSTPEILSAATTLINNNPGTPRILCPHVPSGAQVRLINAKDSFSEGIFIAKEIGRMTGGIDMLESQNIRQDRSIRSFSDIAILCRTHRQMELIERCLQHDDIPCIVSGRERYLHGTDVVGVMSFFRSILSPTDASAFASSLKFLFNCPSDLASKAIDEYCRSSEVDISHIESVFTGQGPVGSWSKMAKMWMEKVGSEKPRALIDSWIKSHGITNGLSLLRDMSVFHSTFSELWDAYALGEEQDIRRASGGRWESGAVNLMTFHASKGLEFPAVFVVGLRAGIVPSTSKDHSADIDEERRLLYVAMTRARDELILTCSPEPSPFINEILDSVIREEAKTPPRPMIQLSLF